MSYDYEIFISYRRTATIGRWVNHHLIPRLANRLDEIAPYPVRIFCDEQMREGVNLTEDLKRRIRKAGLLLSVWSADYFRSAWCMAEWQSFKAREIMLGRFSKLEPQGLVYPVRYADGDYFHPEANLTLCRKDFSRLNYPDDAFRLSARYVEFDDLVQDVATDLVDQITNLPPWSEAFPIVEPQPLPPLLMRRPVI